MQQFLIQYGLVAIFLCALLETDVSFILTGVVIHLGVVHPFPAVIAMLAGALAHDTTWYSAGRFRADAIRNSRLYRKVGPFVEKLVSRFGVWELFLCRFVYGTRNPSLLFWGVHHLPWHRYFAIQLLSLSLWGAMMVSLGYFLSDRAEAVIGKVKHAEKFLLLALAIVSAGFFAIRHLARYIIARRCQPSPKKSASSGV